MSSGIYIISSPSGRFYIGSTKNFNRRKAQHFYKLSVGKHPCDALQKAYVKYEGNLIFKIIELCKFDKLIEREQFWIDNPYLLGDGRIYNSSSIAGRPEHTLEVRNKISEKAKGRVPNEETRRKLSEAGRGRKHTSESLAKILAHGHVGQPWNDQKKELMKTRRKEVGYSVEGLERMRQSKIGKKLSEETKRKMSEAQLRRFQSEEERYKAGSAARGKKKSVETRKRMSEAALKKPPMTEETKQKIREARLRQIEAGR